MPNGLFTYNWKVLEGAKHGCVGCWGDRKKICDRQHGPPAGGDCGTHDEEFNGGKGESERNKKEGAFGSWKVYSYSGE